MKLLRSPCPELHNEELVEAHSILLTFDYRHIPYEVYKRSYGILIYKGTGTTWEAWVTSGGFQRYMEDFGKSNN